MQEPPDAEKTQGVENHPDAETTQGAELHPEEGQVLENELEEAPHDEEAIKVLVIVVSQLRLKEQVELSMLRLFRRKMPIDPTI